MKLTNTLEQLEEHLMQMFDDALGMEVKLSDSPEIEYDLNYISEKLKRISVFQERLSDIQMKITKITLEVTQQLRAKRSLITLHQKEYRASTEYRNMPVADKTLWLANQLQEETEDVERWELLSKMVSEIKEAVGDRAGTIKRLDSDIRLHSKLYEARVHAGATSPHSFTGNSTRNVDID
jgi:hypothetical protein